jgi:hypothetical protein
MKRDFLPPTVPAMSELEIAPDDDTDVAIVKYMSSHKGYTLDEIYSALWYKVQDPEALKPTMFMLNAKGWFDVRHMASTGTTVYVLRPNKTVADLLADTRRPTQVRKKFKLPETASIDPNGKIVISEGADIAIWKLMQDRNWRTAKQILAMLQEFGFEKAVADKRLTKYTNSKSWFDRRGVGSATEYRLKNGVKLPLPSDAPTGPVLVPEPNPLPTTVAAHVEAPVEEVLSVIENTMPEQKIEPVKIDGTEDVIEAIWKVMADRKFYTASDLTVLLTDYGFRASQISPVMTRMHQQELFVRTKVPTGAKTGPKHAYAYQLVEGAVMPIKAKKTGPKPLQEQTQQELPEMHQLVKPVPVVIDDEAPLLNIAISIKGHHLTIAQFVQLAIDLKAMGFGGPAVQKPSLIETQYTIENKMFTRSELKDLYGKILATFEQFDRAIEDE